MTVHTCRHCDVIGVQQIRHAGAPYGRKAAMPLHEPNLTCEVSCGQWDFRATDVGLWSHTARLWGSCHTAQWASRLRGVLDGGRMYPVAQAFPFSACLGASHAVSILYKLFPVRVLNGHGGTNARTASRCHHPVARAATSAVVGRTQTPSFCRRGP